ncbi:LysR family transcriptional regulator [Pseudonocardia sp. DSM 110487]|uniref:LysR substrate-binding domain-containing protein n=1 Tax=Pseudonocardia sp. DSM 110487 TaxID=2865833 RepID=UPI001C6A30D4|nr:LysR family transcriptional regulator [Pseudonocardia sp. DSM 110487]QYN38380.1 LysR family transcriptional regulator [Pseudonocardia sp. DSM 110487]
MDFRALETFLVLAEELHFGHAAERLFLSKARVSQIIRSLEQEVGAPLFDRTSRRVWLTPVGARFRQRASRGMEELRAGMREAKAATREVGGLVRLGYLPSIGPEFVQQLVREFEDRYPRCRASLSVAALGDFDALQAGLVDVLLTWLPGGLTALGSDRLAIGPVLAMEGRAVLVPSDHLLAQKAAVSLDDLVEYPLLTDTSVPNPFREAWIPSVTRTGRRLRHVDQARRGDARVRLTMVQDAMMAVARGECLHLTVESLLRQVPQANLALVPITDMPPCAIVPVWRRGNETATIRAFVDSLRSETPITVH